MIVTLLITFLSILIDGINNILPVKDLDTGIANALSTVGYAINGISYLIDIGALINALYAVVWFEGIYWGYFALLWLWSKLPFVGK